MISEPYATVPEHRILVSNRWEQSKANMEMTTKVVCQGAKCGTTDDGTWKLPFA